MQVSFTYRAETYVFDHPEGDWIGKQQAAAKTFYEMPLLRAIAERRADGVALDVGAHVGNHAVFFSQVLALSTIALEPNRDVLPFLTRNTGGGPVTVLGVAAGDVPGWREVVRSAPQNVGMTYTRPWSGLAETRDLVPCYRLDDLTGGQRVGLLKIDVEGTELDVLMGALRILREDRPLIAMEAQTPAVLDAQRGFMHRYGYAPGERYCATPTYLWTPA